MNWFRISQARAFLRKLAALWKRLEGREETLKTIKAATKVANNLDASGDEGAAHDLRKMTAQVTKLLLAISAIEQVGGEVVCDREQIASLLRQGLEEFPDDPVLKEVEPELPALPTTIPAAEAMKPRPGETVVYIMGVEGKYHRGSCSYLQEGKIGVSLKAAKAFCDGPCSRCNPPG